MNELYTALAGEIDCIDEFATWSGRRPGASVEQVQRLEDRLGCQLPRSHKNLLEVADGVYPFGLMYGRLLPSEEVGWWRDRNPLDVPCAKEFSIDDPDPTDPEYRTYGPGGNYETWRYGDLLHSLEITGPGVSGSVLLNPVIRSANDEWEALLLDPQTPERFESLPALVVTELRRVLEQLARESAVRRKSGE